MIPLLKKLRVYPSLSDFMKLNLAPSMSHSFHAAVLLLAVATQAAVADPVSIPRKPGIENDLHSSSYTTYDFASKEDRDRAVVGVRAVTQNGSFVSRSLLMISNHGLSKKFETITGEDGLTFGVKDFTSGGVLPLLKLINEQDAGAIPKAFGPVLAPKVLQQAWLSEHTSAKDDHGLVALRDFRKGLNQILSDRAWHGAQLQRYGKESVEPSLAAFKKRGFRLEFSLAAMIGVANSFGAGSEAGNNGMIGRLNTAQSHAGGTDEEKIMRSFVTAYALRDTKNAVQEAATEKLIQMGFGGSADALPSQDELSHSGRRIRLLFQIFPWKDKVEFFSVGAFVLAADEGTQ